MQRLIAVVACMAVVLSCSSVFAGWPVAGPVVVRSYAPVAPVYTYPAPVVVARPILAPPPVAVVPVPRPVVVARPVVARPVVVRSKVYVPGQPVRNAIKVLLP